MGPEHRRFIDSALDQNTTFHDHTANGTRIQKVLTVQRTRIQTVYDSALDQNTTFHDHTANGTRIQNVY